MINRLHIVVSLEHFGSSAAHTVLFEQFGFTRDRQIAKWRWVMRLRVQP